MTYEPSPEAGPLRQGEILSDLIIFERINLTTITEPPSPPSPDALVVSWAFVISQQCDLNAEHRHFEESKTGDPPLPSLLFCHAHPVADFKQKRRVDSDIWKRVRQSEDYRYQLLWSVPPECDRQASGVPSLVLDFRQTFSVSPSDVRLQLGHACQRRASLTGESLRTVIQRVFRYHGRIPLSDAAHDALKGTH